MNLENIAEFMTISEESVDGFDEYINVALSKGWKIVKLFQIQESENVNHHFAAHLAKFSKTQI